MCKIEYKNFFKKFDFLKFIPSYSPVLSGEGSLIFK